ncbi:Fe(2+) transport protein A [bacterium HR17]|jgi:ferrous iron transport protein A|uniref:Fe(2+) transport protein A n=1 Tax=Candidatus Fervidibacter japonicus TaxID=2035412 RepID=A0A2H5XBA7_9BACT|nr:Fe(2+) transport protein A [bacterium HR17]
MSKRHRPDEANADRRDRWLPLSELQPNQKAVLRAINAPNPLAHRLMALGIVPGTEVEVVRTAAFGDPMEIRMRGFRLALRKRDAQLLLVEPQPP